MTFTGVLAPLPTPFDADDRLDLTRLRAAFPRWLASPLSGFVVLGTTGEAGLLTEDESDRVIDQARSLIPAGRTLIAGTGRESTVAAIAAARRAAALGVDAVLVRTPSFFKSQMNGDAFVRHYTAVADASPVPVLLYNFTAATGVTLPTATVVTLSEHPNIVGIKESGSDIAQISDLVTMTAAPFDVFAGSASSFYAALCAGVTGGILALAALLPDACVSLVELVKAGRHDEARTLQQRLLPVARLISSMYGLPGLKAALSMVGCDVGKPRLPLVPVDAAADGVIRTMLAAFERVAV
jgi:4-hydroxy-2-oxoglutarate aldolase